MTSLNRADRTKWILGDICQMPTLPEIIKEIVAKIGDLDHNVCSTAINGFVEMAKHGNLYDFLNRADRTKFFFR